MKTNVLIIGGGLAGCMVAWEMHTRGFECLLLDTPTISNASRISAGIINPISGKRFSPLWDSDAVIASMLAKYQGLERSLGQKFLREIPALRLFVSEEEREYWLKKRATTLDFARLVEQEEIDTRYKQQWGGLRYTAWHLEVEALLTKLRQYLVEKEILIESRFDDAELYLRDEGVSYRHISAEAVVFCNGWKTLESRFWKELPLSPAKGELLTVEIAPDELNSSYNKILDELVLKEVFMLPLENTAKDNMVKNQVVRIGASYSWEELNDIPTSEKAALLLEKALGIIDIPMRIVRHDAGVRPAAQDSKPVLGAHPQQKRVWIMNGFGSKGVAYTPFCAEMVADIVGGSKQTSAIPDWCALTRWRVWR